MKLKNILQEIKTQQLQELRLFRGDAAKDTSLDILLGVFSDNNKLKNLINSTVTRNGVDRPAPEQLLKQLLQTLIIRKGNLAIITAYKMDVGSGGDFLLINLEPGTPLNLLVIGHIVCSDFSNFDYSLKNLYGVSAPVIKWSQIATNYRGKGYGAIMYDMMLNHYGALQSDGVLYEGSLAMWTKHMPKVASFVGAMLYANTGGGRLVIPITPEDLNNKRFLQSTIASIVVFKGSPPAVLKRQLQAMQGLSLHDGSMQIIQTHGGIEKKSFRLEKQTEPRYLRDWKKNIDFATYVEQQKAAYATLEEFTTELTDGGEEMLDAYGGGKRMKFNKNAQLIIIIFDNAVAFVTEGAEGIDVWYLK